MIDSIDVSAYPTFRWVDSQGNHKYDCFIPEVPISGTSAPAQATDLASGDKRERQPKKPTEKGALYPFIQIFTFQGCFDQPPDRAPVLFCVPNLPKLRPQKGFRGSAMIREINAKVFLGIRH